MAIHSKQMQGVAPEAMARWREVSAAASEPHAAAKAQKQGSATMAAAPSAATDTSGLWAGESFAFSDLIDMVNPLQHIPIVSTIYRAVTGDEIGAGARMVGGALLGGVVGLVASGINAAIEANTGKDVGEHALAALSGEGLTGFGAATEDVTDNPVAARVAAVISADAARLSGTDPVAYLSAPVIADEKPEAPPEMTREQKAEALLVAQGLNPMLLRRGEEEPQADSRAVFLLGGHERAAQIYQQAQVSDRLHNVALGMDIKG